MTKASGELHTLSQALALAAQDSSPDTARSRTSLALKTFIDDGRERVRLQFEADQGRNPGKAAAALARLHDTAITCLARHLSGGSDPGFAIIATGGYGRGELAPWSDIDLLFLFPGDPGQESNERITTLLYALWDARLRISYSTHSVESAVQASHGDHVFRTSLLEMRPLSDPAGLAAELERRLSAPGDVFPDPAEFIREKLNERLRRHRRFGHSRYMREPNIRNGKGGLRDLHCLVWLLRGACNIRTTRDMVREGILSPEEAGRFSAALRFLLSIRIWLHYQEGRAGEHLTFSHQLALADFMGYRDSALAHGSERLMRRYYTVARDVGTLTRIICAFLEDRGLLVHPGGQTGTDIGAFTVSGSRIRVARPDFFTTVPTRILQLFRIADQERLGIHPETLRHLRGSLGAIDARFRADPAANTLFMEILTASRDTGETLRRMNDAGVLGRFVPAFGRIVARSRRNLYHTYTVDEHTICALDLLSRLSRGELEKEHPLIHRLLPSIHNWRALCVAVLFHDVAVDREVAHTAAGACLVRREGPRLGLSAGETETAAWLVENHLVMSLFAFRRDPHDPGTLADFLKIVSSLEKLRLLLVMTVADIRAVGPNVWSEWKRCILGEMYGSAEEALSGGLLTLDEASQQARLRRDRERLSGLLSGPVPGTGLFFPDTNWQEITPLATKEAQALTETLPDDFFHGLSPDRQYFLSMSLGRFRRSDSPLFLAACLDERRTVSELFFLTRNRPALFGLLAGAVFLSCGTIHSARIITCSDGLSIGIFRIQTPGGEPIVDTGLLEKVTLQCLRGEINLPRALDESFPPPRAGQGVFPLEPAVSIHDRLSSRSTVIEIECLDSPGLLCRLALEAANASLRISSAHIATYGEKAFDVFYVNDRNGKKLSPGLCARVRSALLETALQASPARPGKRRRTAARTGAAVR